MSKDISNNYYVKGFINSNVDSIYKKTKSEDVEKYIILLVQIAKMRLKTKHLTSIDWKNKQIKVKKLKELNDNQLEAMQWIVENRQELYKWTKNLLNNYVNDTLVFCKFF